MYKKILIIVWLLISTINQTFATITTDNLFYTYITIPVNNTYTYTISSWMILYIQNITIKSKGNINIQIRDNIYTKYLPVSNASYIKDNINIKFSKSLKITNLDTKNPVNISLYWYELTNWADITQINNDASNYIKYNWNETAKIFKEFLLSNDFKSWLIISYIYFLAILLFLMTFHFWFKFWFLIYKQRFVWTKKT